MQSINYLNISASSILSICFVFITHTHTHTQEHKPGKEYTTKQVIPTGI